MSYIQAAQTMQNKNNIVPQSTTHWMSDISQEHQNREWTQVMQMFQ